tara:strand:+ start:886 stop:1161 length:276 start_codon:yes stop_codon:yes gene_type:complete
MSEENKTEEVESRDYGIDDNKDYVLVLKEDGETKAYYPMDMVGQEPPPPLDARFVAVAHVLQDQESFEFVINRFREANGLTDDVEQGTEES